MRILFISMGYPSRENPSRLVFLKHLVDEIANQGNQCVVIAPSRISKSEEAKLPYYERQTTQKGKTVDVYFPKYLSAWLQSKFQVDPVRNFGIQQFYCSVINTIKREKIEFDCVYSHFLWISAMTAVRVGRKYNVPVFGAAGESTFEAFSGYEREEVIDYLNQMTGIVSVSSENKRILIENHVLQDSKIRVFPNAVDTSRFTLQNKIEARNRFNIPKDSFVVAFVGHFIERKGPLRVEEATKRAGVNVIFAGKGPQKPQGDNILFCDSIEPRDMPTFLNSADAFVLPTQNEGCCNAIIEAMACGLPIISSDREFNKDVLDSSCSILVDPENVDELEKAIDKLHQDKEYCRLLSDGAVRRSSLLTIEKRANDIVTWMKVMGNIVK